MTRKLFAAAAAALGLLLAWSTFDPAEAGRRGGARAFHGGHVRAFSGRAFHGHRLHVGRIHAGRSLRLHHGGRHFHRHRFARNLIIGVPLAYGAYTYSSGCEWLRHRALVTGSPYWWHRYNACLYGVYH